MNRIPDFQPVSWSLFYWAMSITAPALHKVQGIQLKNEPRRTASFTINNLTNFWGRRWKSPLQLLSMLSSKGNETPRNRILNFPYEFSHDFFLTLVSRMKILCNKPCCILTTKETCLTMCFTCPLHTADYNGPCYWGDAMHRTRVNRTGDVRVMQLPLNLPPKYWHAVDKNFRQYSIIWSPGVKSIWELKAEFPNPIAPRGKLYHVSCTSENEIQSLNIAIYISIQDF